MTKRVFSLVILASLLSAFVAMTALAAKSPVETRGDVNKSLQYINKRGEYHGVLAPGKERPKAALGSAAPSASPGEIIGNTWYDYQRNGSMRRMITWGTHIDTIIYPGPPPDTTIDTVQLIHFVWMRLASSAFYARKCCYQCWNPVSGEFCCGDPPDGCVPPSDDEYAGYCVIDVTNDDRGIVGGHNNLNPGAGGVNQFQAWWDDCPGCCDFGTTCWVPDGFGSEWEVEYNPGEDGFIWPAMCWQEGEDTILHVFAQENNRPNDAAKPGANQLQALAYFRAIIDDEGNCTWDEDYSCYVDEVYTISQDCDCTDEGEVALAWIAPREEGKGITHIGCDTCSNLASRESCLEWDNDVYYQISPDGGLNWEEKVNVTQHKMGFTDPYLYRPYTDLSVLLLPYGITRGSDVHIVWNERYWPSFCAVSSPWPLRGGRIFHWSEDNPDISTVHEFNWEQDYCNGGAWNLNASKMTISECDDKLYVLFVQFNDYNAKPPVVDDCAWITSPGWPDGAANGDLYVCVSDDWGKTWDKARNLTNSYTPACLLDCDNDNWPSMVKFGTDYAGIWPDNVVDPSIPPDSPYTGNWFLDVQYVNDHSAGSIVQDEGWLAEADVKWFRLPCVEPVWRAHIDPRRHTDTMRCWTKHGVQRDDTVTLENIGNCPLTYNVTKEEDTPPSGWLGVSPTGGSISAGDTDQLLVSLNVGGIVNEPGTIVYLQGRLVIDWHGVGCPPTFAIDTVSINCWVTDTLYEPVWDTVHTLCTKLIVGTNGNFGKQGLGNVNMDYVDAGDCDTLADVYLYDGSPVIGYQKNGGTDTVVNFSIFGTSYVGENGFVPLGDHTPTTDMGDYEVFESGKFVTHDSLIAVEMIWYAPRTDPDTCSFVIQCMTVYLNDTLADPPTDVRIAEAIDWDIPADIGVRNHSGFDYDYNLLWQQGSEEDGAGCQSNADRWGGMDFLEVYKNGELLDTIPYGGYIKDNATQVYPGGGFHPDSLYKHMAITGFINSDTQNTDLHMVMIKIVLDVLTKGDTIVIYEQKITHWNGNFESFLEEVRQCRKWYKRYIKPGCCNHDGIRGDANYDMGINVGDLSYLVSYLFDQPPGPAPPCFDEGDVDASGSINVGDLAWLVDYLFGTPAGPAPKPCP